MNEERSPLVVWGEVITGYDFGPDHPLTPRRFGPGLDLVRRTGADRFLEPGEATDEQLGRLHERAYIRGVHAFSNDPWQPPRLGIGPGDCPPFHGMHPVSAAIAGGSMEAAQRIVAGEELHAFNPGGGLHHAMAGRASGFCIYNDVALGIAVARDAGHRVLSVDIDVHHGDGTQALFWDDPEVLTISVHESGRTLFPGTGSVSETGGVGAPGTVLNLPLDAYSGDLSWMAAVERSVEAMAEHFRPTFLVTQHGCDSHAWDPLAHLRVTTAAYARVTRFLDVIAHRYCDGRWLATGGGGYDAYRVVPRSWALVWLAQAHREPPDATPVAWQERWTTDAEMFSGGPAPATYVDPPGTAAAEPEGFRERNHQTLERAVNQALDMLPQG